jgi:hypothetical protein
VAFFDELTVSHVHARALRAGMSLKPLQSRSAKVSEEEIDHVIARTLSEDRQIEARAALPAIASQDELSGQSGRLARRAAQQEGAAAARLDAVAAQYYPAPLPVEDLTGNADRIVTQMMPWLGRGALALMALAVIWTWPLILPVAVVAAVLVPIVCTVALGSDGVANALARLFRWRNARHPDRAERMRARIDGFAMRMDALLDRLPEGWTTGLYMPDFSREALMPDAQADAPDPFDRLRGA